MNSDRRKLGSALDDILATPATRDPASDIQGRMRSARDQLLAFASFPGRVEAENDACGRDLRPTVIQRKNIESYRAMWSARGVAAVRTVVATARMTSDTGAFSTVPGTIAARRPSAELLAPCVCTAASITTTRRGGASFAPAAES